MEVVVILFFFGLSAGVVARIKGSSFFIWFMVGAVLPGIGTIAAALYRFERGLARALADYHQAVAAITTLTGRKEAP